MELVKELFLTGFVAVFFSFLIAKLISMATSSDDPSKPAASEDADIAGAEEEKPSTEELHFSEKLEVQGTKIEQVTEPFIQSTEVKFRDVLLEDIPLEQFPASMIREGGQFQERKEEKIETSSSEIMVQETDSEDKPGVPVEPAAIDNATEEEPEESRQAAGEEVKRVVEIEDDWEGIERSELEKAFAEAARLVGSGEEEERLGGEEVQMELYGLHKVATEGPCREQPPLALKVSARAKWNAWQRLGNMSPEVAMEQYVALVSDRVPGWMEDKSTRDTEAKLSEPAYQSVLTTDLPAHPSYDPNITNDRNSELEPGAEKSDLTGELSQENKVKQ